MPPTVRPPSPFDKHFLCELSGGGVGKARPVVDELIDAIRRRISGSAVVPRREIPVLAAARRATTGLPRLARFDVTLSDGGGLRLVVPARDDLDVERVAMCVETIDRVGASFPRLRRALQALSFDVGAPEIVNGVRWAGIAHGTLGQISLRADLFTRGREAGDVNAITAHECWHQLEFDLAAGDYKASIELRRRLGEALGVATLEHAIRGGDPKAPAPWQAAYATLRRDVTAYASRAPAEATAEMFMLWWTGAPRTPVIEAFEGVIRDIVLPFQAR